MQHGLFARICWLKHLSVHFRCSSASLLCSCLCSLPSFQTLFFSVSFSSLSGRSNSMLELDWKIWQNQCQIHFSERDTCYNTLKHSPCFNMAFEATCITVESLNHGMDDLEGPHSSQPQPLLKLPKAHVWRQAPPWMEHHSSHSLQLMLLSESFWFLLFIQMGHQACNLILFNHRRNKQVFMHDLLISSCFKHPISR